jgi:hypothetical protein
MYRTAKSEVGHKRVDPALDDRQMGGVTTESAQA